MVQTISIEVMVMITQDDLVERISKVALELGRTPTQDEFLKLGQTSMTTLTKVFGKYPFTSLLVAAGMRRGAVIKFESMANHYTDKELWLDLYRIALEISPRQLTTSQIEKHGKASLRTYLNRLGTIKEIQDQVYLTKQEPVIKITHEMVVRDIHRVMEIAETKNITWTDLKKYGAYAVGTYQRYVGNIGQIRST